MADDDLVRRLRADRLMNPDYPTRLEAADRIQSDGKRIAELERELAGRCEHCGARVTDYPMGCPGCGAPQCCQPCCARQNATDRIEALEAELERWKMVAADPDAVHLNMLRGGIAKPSVTNIIHLYGEDALRAALAKEKPDGTP